MDWLIDEPSDDGVFSLFSRKFDDFPEIPELMDDQTPDISDLEKYLA